MEEEIKTLYWAIVGNAVVTGFIFLIIIIWFFENRRNAKDQIELSKKTLLLLAAIASKLDVPAEDINEEVQQLGVEYE